MAPTAPTGTKGARTRRAILEAAIARFGRDGYRATKVADIARDAAVGGTVAYAYFDGKEALFLAALDEDAAGVIAEGLSTVAGAAGPLDWGDDLVLTWVEALDRHPLARRVLSGLEPDVTDRINHIPAMEELREAAAQRLAADQAAGLLRADVDPAAMARGAVAITVSMVMAVLQLGPSGVTDFGDDVRAVFRAAFSPPPRR